MSEQLTLDDAINAAEDERIERLLRDEYPQLSAHLDKLGVPRTRMARAPLVGAT